MLPLSNRSIGDEEERLMDPIDLPLLLSSAFVGTPDEQFPLDRVRMQKAVFLLVKGGYSDWSDLYDYKPYDWGPYSRTLARDIDVLVSRHNLKIEQARGSRYGRYAATSRGEALAAAAWQGLRDGEQEYLRRVRRYVTSKSFSHLLREVYAAYPQYATESRFQG
jgi:uncharacterized protein